MSEIAHHFPDMRPVLLLNVGIVVLVVGPGTSEFKLPFSMTVAKQDIVDEFLPVIRVYSLPLEWRPGPYPFQCFEDPGLGFPHYRLPFPPARGDLGGAQGVDVFPQGGRPTMEHRVNL